MDEIESVERLQNDTKSEFQILPTGYKVNIEFSNLTYEVPDHKQGMKPILKNINGQFQSKQLSVIMGTSGSGKTTLINLLAGYRINKTSGIININNRPQNLKQFHKMSRYILQHDHVSPHFTVMESMIFAAKLKLNAYFNEDEREEEINKVLNILHLKNQANTKVSKLSGGEKKRLYDFCLALELLNIPTVLFLDEPTTGLDEFSAMQCISILRCLVASGRTIICSIHAPSARMFQMFDHVYILADGECVYQGSTTNVLPYVTNIGFECPITYNPADFIIEVAAREYGDFHEKMVNEVKNGKIYNWLPVEQKQIEYLNSSKLEEFELEINPNLYKHRTTPWLLEYRILSRQMLTQMWRDKSYIKLKIFIKLFLAFFISVVYTGIGTNATMLIYNYHLTFLTAISFIFLSMCPMLAHVPLEMNYLRREHFNQWYRLSSYFMALITTQLPDIFLLGTICSALLYFSTDQPMELYRFILFALVTILTSMTASSYGLAISSRLNLLNSLFLGPCIISCWVIFANHSVGNPNLSTFEKILMYSGYIRHSVEGFMSALFDFNRADSICPPDEVFCMLKKPRYLKKLVGFENLNYVHSILYLIGFYIFFNIFAYVNFKCRLGSLRFLEKNRYYQTIKMTIWKYVYIKLY
ncbi:ATP-binding cassette sub-family G member 1 [Lucilia cuprina]|nr:ATP-binding cassette sub-family G member 1 [Lucilia cuprina]